MGRGLLVVQAAGLGFDFLSRGGHLQACGLRFHPFDPIFPAVTCGVQAAFRTGAPASAHGLPANGFMSREFGRVYFWEQSARLIGGPRIWDDFRRRGGRVAMLFWQQSLGEEVDLVVSPAPVHKHGGGMVEDCYSQPPGLYAELCRGVGRPFRLMSYWGPLASPKSSAWIAAATAALLADRRHRPDLCLTYLPALDYDLQRWGPDHPRAGRSLVALLEQLRGLTRAASEADYDVLVFGDYAIGAVTNAAFPNRALAEAGLLRTRAVGGRLYADLHASRAFAVVDHEVAMVYARDVRAAGEARAVLAALPGVGAAIDPATDPALACARAGDLVLEAAPGWWFAYPWWRTGREEPDYASHVDIHNKPGYDPGELFFGWPPPAVSRDVRRIGGSHGRRGSDRRAAWAATFPLGREIAGLPDLAAAMRERLEPA